MNEFTIGTKVKEERKGNKNRKEKKGRKVFKVKLKNCWKLKLKNGEKDRRWGRKKEMEIIEGRRRETFGMGERKQKKEDKGDGAERKKRPTEKKI